MAAEKNRIFHNNRDMIWSLLPLVLICLVIAGIASQCTLSPGGPTQGKVPHVDIDTVLKYDARDLAFPIRNPGVIEGWQPNSGNRGTVAGDGGGDASTIGFLTDKGRYLQLTQSSASEEALVPWVVGDSRVPSGTQQVGPDSWVVYDEEGSEPIWVADFGDVRLLITGSGTADEYTTLAEAVGAAQPLATS
ncbi:DUF4245 domain-containing protein [Rhodococcus kronopolitis]|uniref:DUF4245 domain-containing protein n=1 Tax=Rhodococcus kronopolitis TaxID=1460226 RepID=A0ABV9FX23_9NOCA